MRKFSNIPTSLTDLSFGQLVGLLQFKGDLIAELIEQWTGLDFDICLNETESNDFSWLNVELIESVLSGSELPQSFEINGKMVKVHSDLMDESFGLKMIANNYLIQHDESVITAIPYVLATYLCSDVYGEFSSQNLSELADILSEQPAIVVYPLGRHYIELIGKLNEYQSIFLTIDEGYQTQSGREKRSLIKSFGIDRLERFGDMNLIDDFCTAFPAYKHDDVFKLEFSFVIDRLSRIEVINNITEQLMQFYHDKAKKQ